MSASFRNADGPQPTGDASRAQIAGNGSRKADGPVRVSGHGVLPAATVVELGSSNWINTMARSYATLAASGGS
jgi:hypothetical protein